ncbi:molybdopterin cofactor-binding domain-containing protein [Pseudomonas sp. NPDC089554]|uniref:xanthine dehydrogenase family protein molybdopterin-binding subunit n=1 Tax=Pseudomonas sp. NPDC089554 TaxID=3390653 RepID=UPI003D03DD07
MSNKQLRLTVDMASLSRRNFLVGSVAGTLMMAFAPTFPVLATPAKDMLKDKLFSPTIWFEIDSSGAVTVNITRAEMGQHVGTALARIVADELGADWSQVKIIHVDTDPKWGLMITGGSWSVNTSFKTLSQAGAAGRTALIEAGAKLKGVPAAQCDTKNGYVLTPAGNLSFAEVVQKGAIDRTFTPEQLNAFTAKPKSKHTLIGTQHNALDIPPKTNGSAVYGIDVEVEGMVYARPIVPPTRYGSRVISVDDQRAKALPGYLGFEVLKDPSGQLEGWVSVLAKDYPTAIKAGDLIKVQYQPGPTASVSESDILAEGLRQVNDPSEGVLYINDGDVDSALAKHPDSIEAIYNTHTVLHFALEPLNAIALQQDGKWHIHGGNQWQTLTLAILSKALEVAETDIIIHQYYLGGGFGRRLGGDYMIPAALTAKQYGKPVKLIFTRADDSRFDQVRSASVQRYQANFNADNQLVAMDHAFSAAWPTLTMFPAGMTESVDKKGKVDPFSASGADHWYSIDNHRSRAINNDLAQRTFLPGWLRSVGQGWIVWGLEAFIDEAAHRACVDPLEFRLQMLDGKGKHAGIAPETAGGANRLRHTLEVLKARINYGSPLPANEGIGIALSAGQERTNATWISTAVQVAVDPASGSIRVKKVVMVVDAGIIIHPDGARAQVEGGAMWGLSMALNEHTEFQDGQVRDVNLNTYMPIRMNELPEIVIEFVDSSEFPTGLGEPGVIGIAPAISNAIYQAVGVRLRDLPMRPAHILAALEKKVG